MGDGVSRSFSGAVNILRSYKKMEKSIDEMTDMARSIKEIKITLIQNVYTVSLYLRIIVVSKTFGKWIMINFELCDLMI